MLKTLQKIGILDCGLGNIGSIKNMLNGISDCNIVLINRKELIREIDKLILPGVGKFDMGMALLEKGGYIEPIIQFALEDRKPLLGICLGMQLLGKESEEGNKKGLGLIDCVAKRFDNQKIKVPHMGWNYVKIQKPNNPLVKNMSRIENRFYFVHSYHVICRKWEDVLMTASHGGEFIAAVSKRNIFGTQFHPEKSHMYGKKLLENFVKEC